MPRDSSLGGRLLGELARLGQASAPELTRRLGISQPLFSRLAAELREQLLVTGKARATRYAARRRIDGQRDRFPIFEISETGSARRLALLHAILPEGFYVEALESSMSSGFYADLPYFLYELRPSGFLGRLVPQQHPELELPADVRLWSAAQTLRYLSGFGWNGIGNLIVGEEAFQRYLADGVAASWGVQDRRRRHEYPKRSADVLAAGVPGSSAGGEQPKFLTRRLPGRASVLVKFSPAMSTPLAVRVADLLVAEHLAHEVLVKYGRPAPHSELLVAHGQMYLEVTRFDRTPAGGRRGVLSLLALDAQFVGRMLSWVDSVTRLAEQGVVSRSIVEDVHWLELFGHLIANSDMHGGNLAFFMDGMRPQGLAPVYDMAPARYAGRQGQLSAVAFELPVPGAADSAVWDGASRAALELWQRTAAHRLVSPGFRRIAAANAAKVQAWRAVGRLLPV